MNTQRGAARPGRGALLLIALFTLGLAASAQAKLSGEHARFEQCPYDNVEVSKCLFAQIEGGEVILGARRVPILNKVTLQGGYGVPDEGGFSPFFGAKDGITLSKVPQPIPGGLLGVVAPEKAPSLLGTLIALFFENGLTGVDATLELARPASEAKISENNFAGELGTALRLPVKLRLENPLLGPNCYIGSSSSPILWQLTTGKTNPPPPGKPIAGSAGFLELIGDASILSAEKAKLADNAWPAPRARGCGGPLSFLIDPIVNEASGLPAKAGTNSAVLVAEAYIGSAVGVRVNEAESS
jgi:hypothetical protein